MSRELVAAGNRAALAAAYVEFKPLVLKILRERGRQLADFDDLVQDAFLQLPRCARRCAPDTSLGGCVATAALQAIRSFDARSATSDQTRAGRPSRRVLLGAELLDVADGSASPEETLVMRERAHHLSELLEGLPLRQRQVLIAREIHDLDPDATARLIGVAPASVPTITSRARRDLTARAAASPLADVFAAMPQRGEGRGESRSSRWRRRVGKNSRGAHVVR